ncbi:MAG TPA: sugar porter family MFS transporter [Mycobacteriales bacterium]|nr:sugar porter family MFS transporter [Mycobacteriales bacterium]
MTSFIGGLRDGNGMVARIAAIAAIGGLLFGYDTGVISGALLYIKSDLKAGTIAQQSIVAVLLLGAIVGAAGSGYLADRLGRKWTKFAAGLVYIVGALGAAFAQNVAELVSARFVLGLAVGTASFVAPMYISEVSPPKLRGGLVTFNQLAITVGILVSYLTNLGFKGVPGNWRWMLGIAAIPGVALAVGMLTVPNTPRWLVEHGREEEAKQVLQRLRHTRSEADVAAELAEIRQAAAAQSGSRRRSLTGRDLRPLLTVGLGLAIFQQIVGVNTVIYYAPTILASTGLSNGGAIAQTVFIGLSNVIFTVVAVMLLDRFGRRKFLLTGTVGMTCSLVLLGLYFSIGALQAHAPYLALVGLVSFIASFAVGLGPVFWLMISEIFPLKSRSVAMSACTVGNWGANFVVSFTFLSMVGAITRAGAFFLYAGISVGAMAFFAFRVPETRHRSLEEIQQDLLARVRAHGAGGLAANPAQSQRPQPPEPL